ncbi:hypothetical protein F5X99DRAFT_426341 [Biscogniauxia marginata]|nr:hypothetical protein F5X99DRAFT_426341 [Biscogniauxia marginata]
MKDQVRCMFTIWPYRDANWVVSPFVLMLTTCVTLWLKTEWNTDKSTFEPVEFQTEDGSIKTYKPALPSHVFPRA